MPENFDDLFTLAVSLAGGSEAKLAVAAGCSQNAVWAAKRAKRVSALMAVRIERATGGGVPRWKWRPDLWETPREAVPAPTSTEAA